MRLLLVCCCLIFLTLPASADLYRCVDKDDIVHSTESDTQPIDQSCDWELVEAAPPHTKPPHADWYVIDYSNECKASEGPVTLIKAIQNLNKIGTINSKVTDLKVENGKPVIVRVSADDGVTAFGDVFYRSKKLCKAATNRINRKNAAELNRYK